MYIHVSAKLGGPLNYATQAKASPGGPPQIETADSQLAGGAQALPALSGAQWARELSDYGEVARRVRH